MSSALCVRAACQHRCTHRELPSSVSLLYGKFLPAMTCDRAAGAARERVRR